jgi:hypothetical protein
MDVFKVEEPGEASSEAAGAPYSKSGPIVSPELGVLRAFQLLTLIAGFREITRPSPIATCSLA